MSASRLAYLSAVLAVAAATVPWAFSQGHDSLAGYPSLDFDHKAIQYSEAPVDDPVARVNQKLAKGQLKFEYKDNLGYLPSLLQALNINPDSQALVFSKTSFQANKINPRRPRAIYFSDDAAVGFIQDGEVMEVMGLDPRQGYIFYTIQTQKAKGQPELVRRGIECLQCHLGPATFNVPGELVSSAIPKPDGSRNSRGGAVATDHRVAISARWGGWYVTGTHGSQIHNGNVTLAEGEKIDRHDSLNITSLTGRFNTAAFLRPTSDIVALMTLEHQTSMTSLITRLGWDTRIARQEGKLAGFDARMNMLVDDLVAYMTFAEETPIHEPIKGVSTFTQTFPQRGPRDKQGRSLRDFDLTKRLFRYPLSYMIYSELFDALPEVARDRVYKRLYDVLTGQVKTGVLARMSAEDRRAVLEIVRDTKSGVPSYWKNTP